MRGLGHDFEPNVPGGKALRLHIADSELPVTTTVECGAHIIGGPKSVEFIILCRRSSDLKGTPNAIADQFCVSNDRNVVFLWNGQSEFVYFVKILVVKKSKKRVEQSNKNLL